MKRGLDDALAIDERSNTLHDIGFVQEGFKRFRLVSPPESQVDLWRLGNPLTGEQSTEVGGEQYYPQPTSTAPGSVMSPVSPPSTQPHEHDLQTSSLMPHPRTFQHSTSPDTQYHQGQRKVPSRVVISTRSTSQPHLEELDSSHYEQVNEYLGRIQMERNSQSLRQYHPTESGHPSLNPIHEEQEHLAVMQNYFDMNDYLKRLRMYRHQH